MSVPNATMIQTITASRSNVVCLSTWARNRPWRSPGLLASSLSERGTTTCRRCKARSLNSVNNHFQKILAAAVWPSSSPRSRHILQALGAASLQRLHKDSLHSQHTQPFLTSVNSFDLSEPITAATNPDDLERLMLDDALMSSKAALSAKMQHQHKVEFQKAQISWLRGPHNRHGFHVNQENPNIGHTSCGE